MRMERETVSDYEIKRKSLGWGGGGGGGSATKQMKDRLIQRDHAEPAY